MNLYALRKRQEQYEIVEGVVENVNNIRLLTLKKGPENVTVLMAGDYCVGLKWYNSIKEAIQPEIDELERKHNERVAFLKKLNDTVIAQLLFLEVKDFAINKHPDQQTG